MIKLIILLFFPLGVYANCWQHAASIYGIEPELLYAIAQQESGLKPYVIGKNKNGSKDLGVMQINSSHLPRLKELGVNEKKLVEDPCLSVVVGASILSDMMKIYGYSWEAVGAYNAGISEKRKVARMHYAEKVWSHYKKIKEEKLIDELDVE